MATISILTPVFNGIEFLEECINSVRSQTFPDWELWIGINGHGVDGGEVGRIATQLAKSDSRIHVIIQGPPLKGKVESLNHLVSLVSTKWVAILDCDDIWEPTKLETQVRAIQSHASEAAVIGTFCRYFGERSGSPTLESGYIDPSVLENYNPIINSSSLILREYCKWENNDINYTMDDYHLWMKICLLGGKLYTIPEYLVWHRVYSTSAFNSKGYSNDALREWYKKQRNTKLNSKNMACTIVTAYYPIKSKFSIDRYMDWASTFLQLKSPIVLFTEESMVNKIREKRGDRPIHIITTPFCELETWKLYESKWKEQYKIDPENHIHTPELYTVWAEKPFFVERAIQINPFQTDFFFWCDIGAFRNPNISQTIIDTFPTTRYLESEKILFQSVGDLKASDWIQKADGIRGECISRTWNEIRLVGGLWGGGINACLRWKNAYHRMLEAYFEAGRFAGKDQQVMLSAYLNDTTLAKVVRCTNFHINDWFFLEHLLSDLSERYELNTTYQST
jgi:glycosyltransferase involved in cell wall biosynthesis